MNFDSVTNVIDRIIVEAWALMELHKMLAKEKRVTLQITRAHGGRGHAESAHGITVFSIDLPSRN
jgi:hypothetical protein